LIVLTDNREWARRLRPELGFPFPGAAPVEDWQDLPPSGLPAAEQKLWQALGPDTRLSRGEIQVGPELSEWDYLVLIDEAPESQYDILRKMDPAGLPGSVACLAATGRGFHGHRQRVWTARRGNLHLSTFCNPDLDATRCGLAMTTLPAVAVMDALAALGPWAGPPGIKWVNDILIRGRKVAGVLTATQSLRRKLVALTLGIGLNVEVSPAVPATPFVPATGCLADLVDADKPPSVGSLLAGCLAAVSRRLQATRRSGPDALIQAYIANSLIIGRRVEIWPDTLDVDTPGAPLARGVVKAIAPDLSLTLEGHPDPIHSGRLAFPEISESH